MTDHTAILDSALARFAARAEVDVEAAREFALEIQEQFDVDDGELGEVLDAIHCDVFP